MKRTDDLSDQLFEFLSPPKRAIVKAAVRAFGSHGYGGVNIADIARASGMSKPRILYHYKDADEILADIARAWSESGRKATVEYLASKTSSTAEQRILDMSTATFIWMSQYPGIAKLTPALFQAVESNKVIAQVVKSTLETGIERIRQLLQQRDQRLSEKELYRLCRTLHSQMMGGALYVISMNAWENIEIYRDSTLLGLSAIMRE